MSSIIADGTFTTAQATGPIRWSAPIQGVATKYVIEEDYVVHIDSFPTLALDTPHGSYPDYVLVSESNPTPEGGGLVRWTRTYAKVPSSHSEWETHAYNFVGYYGSFGINTTTVTGRDRKVRAVLSQVLHEYFLCATGQTYTTPDAIPKNAKTEYYYGTADVPVDYLGDSPPLATASTPSRTTYEGWVADAVANKWSATTGKLTAEDSTIDRWMGNIWVRRTRYVLAQ